MWHGVNYADVARYSPPLGALVAGDTEEGIEALAGKLASVLRGSG